MFTEPCQEPGTRWWSPIAEQPQLGVKWVERIPRAEVRDDCPAGVGGVSSGSQDDLVALKETIRLVSRQREGNGVRADCDCVAEGQLSGVAQGWIVWNG
jgi:hypothetical protein